MAYAFKTDDEWVEIDQARDVPNPTSETEGSTARIGPAQAESLPAETRAALGLVEIVEPAAAAYGLRVTGSSLADVNDTPHRVWTTETIPLAELKAARIEDVRVKRADVEVGGIVRNAAPLKTDERTQNRVTGALKLFDEAPQLDEVDWEVAPGVFVTMDRDTVKGIGVAIGLHIQACFSRSRVLCAEVAAAADTAALLAIDIEAGWPT